MKNPPAHGVTPFVYYKLTHLSVMVRFASTTTPPTMEYLPYNAPYGTNIYTHATQPLKIIANATVESRVLCTLVVFSFLTFIQSKTRESVRYQRPVWSVLIRMPKRLHGADCSSEQPSRYLYSLVVVVVVVLVSFVVKGAERLICKQRSSTSLQKEFHKLFVLLRIAFFVAVAVR